MIAFSIPLRSAQFLDRAAVHKAVGKRNARALGRVGAFIRRRARSSMRRRKKVSTPGSPPSAHSTDKVATLKNIQFFFDQRKQSLVVGPVKLNQANDLVGGAGRVTIPQLMEHGGRVSILEKSYDGTRWRRADRRRRTRAWEVTRRRIATYQPRPFMGPALIAETHNIPRAWRGVAA